MAKSVPDTKLEDVLSSVRRLVSDELPRNERPKIPEGPGALVLTDSQRIESNASFRNSGRSLEERIAELEAAVGETASDDEFEPDGSEDQAQHRPDRIVYTRPPLPEESEEMGRNTLRLSQIALIDTGPANDEADEDSDVQLQFRRDAAPDNPEPEDEAPMAEDVKERPVSAEVHVFASPDDEIARIEARLNGDPEPEPEPASVPETIENAPIILPLKDSAQVEEAQREEDTVADVAEPEVASQGAVDAACAPVEDDFDADLEAAVSSSQTDGEETSEEIAEGQVEQETEMAEAAIGAAMSEILDEDELRPLVAKLIREELQGELGERITRNVRKLVRREILRALAARDAE